MPSVCPSSEVSRCLSSGISSRQVRRVRSRRRSLRLPAKLARLLRHPDAAETFMRRWLARFHGEYPGLYAVLAARRTDVKAGGTMRRLVIEAARFQPQRQGAGPEWFLICWCIDGPGVVFHRFSTKEVALSKLSAEPMENDFVFSPTAVCGPFLTMPELHTSSTATAP